MRTIQAVFGLGNPGSQYRGSFHNLGFEAVDRILTEYSTQSITTSRGELYELSDAPVEYTGKPGEYVNRSGEPIREWTNEHDLPPEEILIIYDDFELELGEVRIRESGGAGGHNGIKSIINELGTNKIPRLRIGIGPLPSGMDVKDFVLAEIPRSDRDVLNTVLDDVVEIISVIDQGGMQKAINRWNGIDYGS
ncbi:MAG: aminoacyl-tRNA hydrolase [bacterium]